MHRATIRAFLFLSVAVLCAAKASAQEVKTKQLASKVANYVIKNGRHVSTFGNGNENFRFELRFHTNHL